MRNSNKVLLIAVAAIMAFVVAFVVVMGLTARELFEQHGRTVQADYFRANHARPGYCLAEASSTIDLSLSSTLLPGSRDRASSSTESAS
ncbi:MAG: hypothetical protein JSV89_14790 [Spirochaetaceae bacterium]|nr:MAG: hypothetical protein JSV89_14790 [Spirochaetaceae bacterium]